MENSAYYGRVIRDYENSNRAYPKELFENIVSFSKIDENSKLLEIGAGPGTATDGFLNYGIDALEITEEQTEYLKQKYAAYRNVQIHHATFEAYETDVLYDLIYSGTAFHWIDPQIAYYKAAKMLKKGGTLALFWNMTFGIRGEGDYRELQNIEKRYNLSLSDRAGDFFEARKLEYSSYIYSTGLFTAPICCELSFPRNYNADNYIAWLKSRWFKFGELSPEEQTSFINDIRSYFKARNDSVEIQQRILLVLAKRNGAEPYQFIDRKDMRSLTTLRELANVPDLPEHHFLHCADETLYVVDDSELYGMIMPGDIIRYHSGSMPGGKINRNFMSVSAVNDTKAIEYIFDSFKTIYEIPVIQDGIFLGCIKSSKRKSTSEWSNIRKMIQHACGNEIDTGMDMADLFMSLNEDEQRKLLSSVFDPSYVDLYRNNYKAK